ncbi:hypothetical protein [Xanthomonas phaseoli]|uniref:hypothetical protein n=1 Tax=Xanthomonas phaseoli TaxID=1985254 RepID=UPI000A8C4309|nr:hypothetical protein [Xanthomonas phaseoli]MBO9788647.1 hypothetical protein [Xanthomonas phaseoli pv. dieffenbachiae]MBO9831058.1 hypothetical protein [Xanthomonas phaseoli pv. dieffenbachiae]MBO9837393.1 hypothetical protein [Xanthomonas phaseoli pv. dieffenbachiae]MBO9839367.1 hypothetical protein [Xanthomonas phaseoli pv. dieffenbachiae]MBO9861028.1 hypothetical protein [Xanthomonas phaseoli pv. dieffenbachiae]
MTNRPPYSAGGVVPRNKRELVLRQSTVGWQWHTTGYTSPDQCAFVGQQTIGRFVKGAHRAAMAAVTPPEGQPFVDPDAETGLPYATAEAFYDTLMHTFAAALQEHARVHGHQFRGVK